MMSFNILTQILEFERENINITLVILTPVFKNNSLQERKEKEIQYKVFIGPDHIEKCDDLK